MNKKYLYCNSFQEISNFCDGATSKPRGWPDVVRCVADELGLSLRCDMRGNVLDRNGIWFRWHTSNSVMVASFLSREVSFLFWGAKFDKTIMGRLRKARLKYILTRAKVVLVNDLSSKSEVYELSRRTAEVAPYPVDTDFFYPSDERNGERSYVVVPGNNGRDEDAVIALVRSGLDVYRVTSSEKVKKHYDQYGLGDIVKYRVSFDELRSLYRSSVVTALPLLDVSHAAGQTSLLEAAACGANIVVSKSRTANIVQESIDVTTTANDDNRDFVNLVQAAINRDRNSLSIKEKNLRACKISMKHSVRACVIAVANLIRESIDQTA